MTKRHSIQEIFPLIAELPNKLVLQHYSASNKENGLEHYEALGGAFLTLISSHILVSSTEDEKRSHPQSALLKKNILDHYSEKFLLSSLFDAAEFGPGISEDEKRSERILHLFVRSIIGQVILSGQFYSMYNTIGKPFNSIQVENEGLDYKTLLQELLQKRKLKLPTYETVSVSGPQHDMTFKCMVFVGSDSFYGEGKSKKLAQQQVAKTCYQQITNQKQKDQKVILRSPFYSLDKSVVQSNFMTFDKSIYQKIGVSESTDILPAYIHPRIKDLGYWGRRSNKTLSMLGSHLLEFIVAFHVCNNFIEGNLNGHNKAGLSRKILKSENLASIFKLGFLPIEKLPIQHDELDNQNYKIDCVQSLFFISFCYHMNVGSFETFIKTQIFSWLEKRVRFECSKDVSYLNNNHSSLAVERLQGIGITFEFYKGLEYLAVKLTQINSEQTFIYNPNSFDLTNRERKKFLSSKILQATDISEGLSLTGKEEKNSKRDLKILIEFIDKSSKTTRIDFAKASNAEIPDININHLNSFSDLTFSDQVEAWSERDNLSLIEKIELLGRIRCHLGVTDSINNISEFVYLPIIFDEHFDFNKRFSIIDFNDNDFVEAENREIENNQPIPAIAGMPEEAFTIHENIINNEIEENTFSEKSPPNINKSTTRDITQLIKETEKLTLSELEHLWRNRRELLESAEEASLIIARLRYERGIDFIQNNYLTFLKTDMVLELDLPPFHKSMEKEAPTQSISLEIIPQQEIKNSVDDDYDLKQYDDRQFAVKKLAVRSGQTTFRQQLLNRRNKCYVTDCAVLRTLEAAHIAPYRGSKDNHLQNGLVLRSDIHKLFDSHLFSINPESLEINIAKELFESDYAKYEGKRIEQGEGLSKKALMYHWSYFVEQNKK